jgi:hypothetical protein
VDRISSVDVESPEKAPVGELIVAPAPTYPTASDAVIATANAATRLRRFFCDKLSSTIETFRTPYLFNRLLLLFTRNRPKFYTFGIKEPGLTKKIKFVITI